MRLTFLAAHSLGLRPAERLWSPVDEPVANRAFADLGELEDALAGRCRELEWQRRTLRSRCCYHWWPRERRPRNQE